MELETLNAYMEINLKTGFICLFKSSAGASIFFDKKLKKYIRLCVDYWGLNNLTIKNCYALSLIGESLNQLDYAKRFT